MLRSLLVNVPTANAMKSIDPMSWILICYSINLHLERHLDDAMMVLWLLRKICLYGIFFMCAIKKKLFCRTVTMCKNDYN